MPRSRPWLPKAHHLTRSETTYIIRICQFLSTKTPQKMQWMNNWITYRKSTQILRLLTTFYGICTMDWECWKLTEAWCLLITNNVGNYCPNKSSKTWKTKGKSISSQARPCATSSLPTLHDIVLLPAFCCECCEVKDPFDLKQVLSTWGFTCRYTLIRCQPATRLVALSVAACASWKGSAKLYRILQTSQKKSWWPAIPIRSRSKTPHFSRQSCNGAALRL